MGLEESLFNGLNEAQESAVRTTEGPVLVVAGPGTGKTLTIVRRIAYLIHRGTNPANIAAVTFTNRAAKQMREMADALFGKDSGGIFIGTLHLLGFTILRDNLPESHTIYSRDEQLDLLKSLLKGSGIKAQDAADRISRIKSLMEDAGHEMKGIFDAYQSALSENRALDFDDLIIRPVELLSDCLLLNKYRGRFRHVIVDEYQDINPAQYRLLKLLAGDKCNICAVGDSDQAIYAFRGADIENFLNFEKDFKGANRISLTHNYRSTGTILGASHAMIANNARRIVKDVFPTKEGGDRIAVVSVPDERAEGDIIVNEIEARIGGTSHYRLMNSRFDRVSDASCGFSDFAVIFRTNAQARVIEEAFIESGIPYQVIGRRHTQKGKGLADIISLLKGCGIEGQADELLNLLTPADAFDPRADAVALMTLHMAKGLEFGVVFIAGLEDGLVPHTTIKDSVDIEEERRLLYVGMTRARAELFLIYARSRFLYGQRLIQSPSPFLTEIPDKFIDRRFVPDRTKKHKEDKQMKLF